MCYNSEMSFYFATAGMLTISYIYLFDQRFVKTGIQYILLFYKDYFYKKWIIIKYRNVKLYDFF